MMRKSPHQFYILKYDGVTWKHIKYDGVTWKHIKYDGVTWKHI